MVLGTISPTKPIRPQKLTAAPARTAARNSKRKRTAPTGSPRLFAVSLPSPRISICQARESTTATLTRIRPAAGASLAMVTPLKPPTRKSATPSKASGFSVTTASIPAPNKAETATPARTTVIRDAPVRQDSPVTTRAATSAPQRAIKGVYCWEMGATAQQSATANPAPELTPITPGDARGFPSTV